MINKNTQNDEKGKMMLLNRGKLKAKQVAKRLNKVYKPQLKITTTELNAYAIDRCRTEICFGELGSVVRETYYFPIDFDFEGLYRSVLTERAKTERVK